MKKLLLIVSLLAQNIMCCDGVIIKQDGTLRMNSIDQRYDQYMVELAEQELSEVAQQLDDLRLLLGDQEATQKVQNHTGQDLQKLVTVLETKFVNTVELFSTNQLSPDEVLTITEKLFKASCPPLLAHAYYQQ